MPRNRHKEARKQGGKGPSRCQLCCNVGSQQLTRRVGKEGVEDGKAGSQGRVVVGNKKKSSDVDICTK